MAAKTRESKKIRDLIRIGIFTALWIAVGWIIACTIGFFPPILVILPCILAVAGAVIYVVMLSKLNTRGGIFIPSFIFGLCLFTMVPYGMLFICTSIGGLLGEIIYDTVGKKSNKAKAIGISLPMVGMALGEYIPLCYMKEAFKELYEGSFTSTVGMKAIEILSAPLAIVLTIMTLICAIFGYLWGRKIVMKRLANQGGRTNEKTQNKKSGIPRLLELAGEKKTLMVWGCILSTANVFFQLVPFLAVYNIMAELLKNASDLTNADTGFMVSWAVKGIAGLLIGYVFMYFGGMSGHTAAYRTLYGIRVRLTEHISELPLGWFNRNAIGKVRQIAEQDVEQIEKFIAHQFPDMVNTIAMLIVMVIIMFRLNVWLALACIIPIIAGFTAQFSMMFGSKAREGLKEYYDALENISTSSVQYVRGMPSIKIFGQTVHSFRKFYQDIMNYRDFSTKYADNYEPTYCLFRVLVLSLATFILAIGIFLFSGDSQNMAFAITLLFFLIFAPSISIPVFKFNSLGSSMNNITEGVRRLDEIMSEIPIQEPSEGKIPQGYDIAFEHVSFSYGEKGSALVLKDVSFRAKQGQITALVGPSGSGKSTIAQLIPRFWDIGAGQIKIGGVDIRDMKTEDLMASMSFVFQDSFLFSDTLYNNIAVGKPSATKEEVYAAAKAAQCHEFIGKLPKGYDTLIGEGGVYLSGGEEQRVAVARAILKNAPILILDEATAYADPENEYQMQLALQELIKNKTVLIIAHRLITIQNANKIEVINEGKIEAEGTHNELLQKSKTYSAMWDAYMLSSDWQILKKKEVVQA